MSCVFNAPHVAAANRPIGTVVKFWSRGRALYTARKDRENGWSIWEGEMVGDPMTVGGQAYFYRDALMNSYTNTTTGGNFEVIS